jgi:hypothetical protein
MADETFPIFGDATLALALMDFADANQDDDEVRAAVDQRDAAREALQKAHRAHGRAVRVGDAYPKEDLAVLKARVTHAETEAGSVSARLRDAADRRLRRARTRRADVLNEALARPADVDPVSDRLDQTERRRRLEALDPAERVLMLTTAAREGTYPELVRSALSAESPPFATKSWQPLLPDEAVEEIREWTMARRAPETIADVRAAWRLRRLAHDLDLDRAGYPRPGTPPGLDVLSGRPVGAS